MSNWENDPGFNFLKWDELNRRTIQKFLFGHIECECLLVNLVEMPSRKLETRQMFRIWSFYQGVNYSDMILEDGVVPNLPKGKSVPIEYSLAQHTEYPLLHFYLLTENRALLLFHTSMYFHTFTHHTHVCVLTLTGMHMHTQLYRLISVGTIRNTLCAWTYSTRPKLT